jgi:serine/threonine protein phosphatase PrpC
VSGFFQSLFKKPKQPAEQENEERSGDAASEQAIPPQVPAAHRLEPPQLIAGSGHSIGKKREHNEDAYFCLTATLVNDANSVPFGLYIVADGMGGHQHGEIASSLAVRAMSGYVMRDLHGMLFDLSPSTPADSLQEIMEAGVQAAHQAVVKHTPGGGSTITGILILGDRMIIAHVGDSRAYLIHPEQRIEAVTRDHSFVNRLVELGQISIDEAAIHPQRNVLYRALGQGEPVDVEIASLPLPLSSQVLICSDGLWGTISDEDILRIVSSAPSPTQACLELVEAANAAGGPDNISVILVRTPD